MLILLSINLNKFFASYTTKEKKTLFLKDLLLVTTYFKPEVKHLNLTTEGESSVINTYCMNLS